MPQLFMEFPYHTPALSRKVQSDQLLSKFTASFIVSYSLGTSIIHLI